jgi:hypothetical protein
MARGFILSSSQSLLPLCLDRWQKQQSGWTGVRLSWIGRCTLELSPSRLRQVDRLSKMCKKRDSASKSSTQLVFGFRPVSWAAIQVGQHVLMDLSLSSMCSFHINRAGLLDQIISDELPLPAC